MSASWGFDLKCSYNISMRWVWWVSVFCHKWFFNKDLFCLVHGNTCNNASSHVLWFGIVSSYLSLVFFLPIELFSVTLRPFWCFFFIFCYDYLDFNTADNKYSNTTQQSASGTDFLHDFYNVQHYSLSIILPKHSNCKATECLQLI